MLRARFRLLFFLVLGLAALALGHRAGAAVCVAGLLSGLASVRLARYRGQDMAHTFAVIDWLLLGCVLALSGGTGSWLLPAVPLLAMGQLGVAPRSDWPYLLAPALLLVIVLAIADPSLGGNRAAGVLELAVLVGGGVVAAGRLRRPARRRGSVAKVDDATGLYTASRMEDILRAQMATALQQHEPLSVVYLRLEHFADARTFLGPAGTQELLHGVTHRLQRHLGPDAVAFRARPDALVAALPGVPLTAARELAAAVCHDVSANVINGRRQTLAAGAASFPAVRDLAALLAAAEAETRPDEGRQAAPQALPLAAAR